MIAAMPLPNPTPEEAWAIVQSRDPHADGQRFYGVRTTGVFCRPNGI